MITVTGYPERFAKPLECSSSFRYLGYALFFMMLFVPTNYQAAKMVLLVLVLGLITLDWTRPKSKVKLRPQLALPLLFYAALGCFFALRGAMSNTPGALPSMTVYVLWPLVFLVLLSAIHREKHLADLTRVLVISGIAIGAYGCLYVLTQSRQLPASWYFVHLEQGQIYQGDFGFATANFTSLSTLLFLLPFLVTLSVVWPADVPLPIQRRWIHLAIVLDASLVMLSARRAIFLVVALVPVFVILVGAAVRNRGHQGKKSGKLVRRMTIIGLVFFAVSMMLGIQWAKLFVDFKSGFDTASSNDATLRVQELRALWAGIADNPFLGSGLGASAKGSIRSIQSPWAYELSYIALIFHVGLIGFVVYVSGVLVSGVKVVLASRRDTVISAYAAPVIVGWLSFLCGNFTNPYLEKFDSMWVIFFPLALLNVAYARREASEGALDPATRNVTGE